MNRSEQNQSIDEMNGFQNFIVFLASCGLAYAQVRNEVNDLNRHTCGLATRGFKYDGRIANGETAADGQFPWYAQMVVIDDLYPVHVCGASILTPRVLLTAAHCLTGNIADYFQRGKVDFRVGSNLAFSGDVMQPRSYLLHPRYDGTDHDIALVFLWHPIPHLDYPLGPPPSKEIHRYRPNAVCLPQDGQYFGDYISYDLCGMGYTNNGSATPYLLQWAPVHTPSPTAREQGINCTRHFFCFPDRMIMTYDNYNTWSGSCRGDSGGPMVRMNPPQPHDILKQRATLAGVVSRGAAPGCLMAEKWTIFARVAYYTRWIRQEIKKYFDELEE